MKTRFKFFFWAGVLSLLVVSALAAWSVSQLRSGLQMRQNAFSFQAKLDDLLEALQEADNSFLVFKMTSDEAEYQDFVQEMEKARQEIDQLLRIHGTKGPMRSEILQLRTMIDEKVNVSRSVEVQHDLLKGPTVHNVLTVRDDLVLTEAIRDRIESIDRALDQEVNEHQSFIDRYYGLIMMFFALAFFTALFFFFAFAYFVSKEIERRIRLELELRKAQDSAISASNLKSQFLATVSHEIRTPLNGIIGMSDVLRSREINSSDLRRYSDIIYNSGKSLLRIVNDLLDLSKIEADKMDLEIQSVTPAVVIESAAELFGRKAMEQKIHLLAIYDVDFCAQYATDGARVAQVLHNLISNAVKFTDKGSVFIEGKVIEREGSEVFLYFSVTDTGIGIPKAKISELFQPFHQLDVTHRHEGTGLGLAITKKLVEILGGKIGVESSLDEGSRFWFEVPVRKVSPVDYEKIPIFREVKGRMFVSGLSDSLIFMLKRMANQFNWVWLNFKEVQNRDELTESDVILVGKSIGLTETLAHVIEAPTVITPEKIISLIASARSELPFSMANEANAFETNANTILLVEDNPTNQLLAQALLEGLGYRVHLAANGHECLEAMKNYKYDIVLMDCRMPEMDGFEATRHIRESETRHQIARVPVIAMTANAIEGDRNRCLAAGMDDYISKPFDLNQLNVLIKKWSGQTRSEVDWSVVRTLSGRTNPDVVKKLIASLIISLRKSLELIDSQTKKMDWKALSHSVHQIKSSAAALGAQNFAKICDQIESEIESKGFAQTEICEQLIGAGKRVLLELEDQKIF